MCGCVLCFFVPEKYYTFVGEHMFLPECTFVCVCVCTSVCVCRCTVDSETLPYPPHLTLFQTRPTNEECPIMQNPPKRAHTSTVPDPLAIHMQMHIYI